MHVTEPTNPNFEGFKKLIPRVESFDAKRTDGFLKVLARCAGYERRFRLHIGSRKC
jgi:hypothetical protein